jgi:sulfatase modifying factor 1
MCERSKSLSSVVLCILAVGWPSILRADTHQDVAATVGQEFTVELTSTPGAGYSWVLAEALPSWLVQVDKTWVADNPNVIGGPGTETWTFRATAAGTATLTFQYERLWEGTPIDTHVCDVTATPPTDTENISVAVGEEFTVELASNPSTGYSWVLAGSLPSWLILVNDEYIPDPVPPGYVGGGGTEYWTFRATAAGTATLTFDYKHPWEVTAVKTHVCSITATSTAGTENIFVAVGDEFTVELDSNPSTGYSWGLASSLPSWLVQVGKTYVADTPGLPGGGGTEYWMFRATAAGSATVTFEYKRPWESMVAKTHVCQVTALAPGDIENILVAVGEEFTVELASNPSTGYSWALAGALPSWLEQVGMTYVPTNPGMIGGGGTESWTFRATAAGSGTLMFQYLRPWEGIPIQTHVCRVTAETQEPNLDGFETGDFSALAWKQQDTPWQITTDRPFAGEYCARSGVIGDDGISTLTYTRDCRAGQIGFAVRISSEPKYDCLFFRIDGQEIAVWSGEQAWVRVSYPVSAGTHAFTWSYEKDKSKAVGEDAAWIDEVTIPEPNRPAGIVLVKIPGGTFEMGNHEGSGDADERPVHTVTLRSFQMSKYETTNAQYAAYLNAALARGLIQVVKGVVYAATDGNLAEPYFDTSVNIYSQIEYSQYKFSVLSRDGKSMADHPVVQVSWYGARAFCDYYGYRLPTEAEWEYAARGGYHEPYYQYPWDSNSIDCRKANYKDAKSDYCNPLGLTSYPYTSPVGYCGPQGAYGLCDMAGNAWEYCQDWYDATYYSSSPASNPAGPVSGTARVFRGGSWTEDGASCRVANRYWHAPASRNWGGGFRVCR